jgi:hypothetical protein
MNIIEARKKGMTISPAALALSTRITIEDFRDVYKFASMIDTAFKEALKQAVEDERQRIFRMSFIELWCEFWKGRQLRKSELVAEK